MPFQNQSLIAVLVGNPPRGQYAPGHAANAYLTRLVDELVRAFPGREHDIRQRSHDLKRRFAVMINRFHPNWAAGAAQAQRAAPRGGGVAAPDQAIDCAFPDTPGDVILRLREPLR